MSHSAPAHPQQATGQSRSVPRHNLPAELTPFIGRAKERADVARLLLEEGVRLLTLTGPPGIGKTRLSIQSASDLLRHFHDGVYFVPLASITDPGLVPSAIGEQLDIRQTGQQPLPALIAERLRDKELFLLLDNFEQVVQAGPLVKELLEACPRLKVLVTSRQALRVTGEQEFPVPPLNLPGQLDYGDIGALSRYEAVSLFTQRARAVKPDFALSGNNASAVARICVQLDGLPLAIELAAARVKLLPPQAMLLRLAHGSSLLASGAQDLPARQRTLHSAIAWSYDLLSEEEKVLFRRLGVFAGGFTFEAADAVCNPRGGLGFSTLEGLALLLDKSLLKPEFAPGEDQEAGIHDEPRFMMLETIKQFAREKLEESGEAEEIRWKHALYFLSLAEQAEPHLRGPEQAKWFARIAPDHDDFRAALQWSIHTGTEGPEANIGLRMATALSRFWYTRGYLTEGREWLSAVLSTGSQESTMLRSRALAEAGALAYLQSDYAATRTLFTESLAVCREIGDSWGVANALDMLGEVETEVGDYPAALRLFEEALSIQRELGNTVGMANSFMQLGWAAMRSGDYPLAVERLSESLAACRKAGDPILTAFALAGLGEAMVRLGRYEEAEPLLAESLEIRRELGHKWGIAAGLGTVSWAALKQSDPDRAADLLRESILIRQEIGDKGGVAWCLERFADVARALRQFERAATLLGAAKALRDGVNSVVDPADQPEHERNIADTRRRLGEKRFNEAWDEGQAMGLQEAIACALEPLPSEPELTSTARENPGGLTDRELEVASLIAQTKSNTEIAEALVVSKRTVETHITNILSKLGFTSRGQIAAWALKKGLTGRPD